MPRVVDECDDARRGGAAPHEVERKAPEAESSARQGSEVGELLHDEDLAIATGEVAVPDLAACHPSRGRSAA